MKHTLAWILAVSPLGTEPLLAQRIEPVNSLGRAKSTFELADTDKNARVTLDELARQKLAIRRADFDAMDADKDGAWSREEFLVYYRHLLVNSGQRPGDDLEAEVARIQTLRHARAAAARTQRPLAPPPASTPAAPAAPTAEDALRLAIDDLEKRAALRQATREDFERVRVSLVERAKLDNAANPASIPDLVAKYEAALTALEARAKAGNFDREDFTALRAMLAARARDAARNIAGPTPAASAAGANGAETDTGQLDAALDTLTKNAEARHATPEDFQRLRAAWMARARVPGADPAAAARDAELDQKFARALEALERDAREGGFTRAQFDEIRASYISRARLAAGANAPVAASTEAAPGVPAPAAPAPPSAPKVEPKLDAALDELARKAEAHAATEDDFRRVREAWIAESRAAIQSADPEAAARQATLEEKFTRALLALEQDARAGKYSREQFVALRESYVARARYAAGANSAQPAPAPLPASAPAPVESSEEAARRFDEALTVFEQRVVAHGATRDDFQRVYELLVARARAAVAAQAGSSVPDSDPRLSVLISRLQGVLARLERTLATGAPRSEDFAFLRDAARGRVRDLPPEPPAPVKEAPQVPTPSKAPETAKPVDTAKPGEAQKPAEIPKPAEGATPPDAAKSTERPAPGERVRPAPAPEAPKPADAPKVRERPVPPADPPHAAQCVDR